MRELRMVVNEIEIPDLSCLYEDSRYPQSGFYHVKYANASTDDYCFVYKSESAGCSCVWGMNVDWLNRMLGQHIEQQADGMSPCKIPVGMGSAFIGTSGEKFILTYNQILDLVAVLVRPESRAGKKQE